MTKKIVRLTESDLHKVISESVKRVLNEDLGNNNLVEEIKEFLSKYSSKYNVFFDEKHNAYGISGNDNDLNLWGGVFFAQSRFNLKFVAISSLGVAYFKLS